VPEAQVITPEAQVIAPEAQVIAPEAQVVAENQDVGIGSAVAALAGDAVSVNPLDPAYEWNFSNMLKGFFGWLLDLLKSMPEKLVLPAQTEKPTTAKAPTDIFSNQSANRFFIITQIILSFQDVPIIPFFCGQGAGGLTGGPWWEYLYQDCLK
jgi:hypothetical protein